MLTTPNIPKPLIKPTQSYTKATSTEGVRKNMEWLKRHHHEYQGQWIALNEGMLVGAHESALELHKILKTHPELPSVVLISLKMAREP